MDKVKFKAYFLKKASAKQSDDQGEEDIFVTKVVCSAANVATNADVSMAENEIEKDVTKKVAYQKNVSEKIQREVGIYASQVSTNSALKKFAAKYPRLKLQRTTEQLKKKIRCRCRGKCCFQKMG